jgi:UDP-glucose 4-epimerase
MRCLVTGASGHLGSYLTRLLVEKGEDVAVLVRPSSDLWRLGGLTETLKFFHADFKHMEDAEESLRAFAPETVFHLAWSGITADTRNKTENIVESVAGSLELYRIVSAAGCRTWIGVGSQAEYGFHDCVLTESLVPKPDSPYGAAKLALSNLTGSLCARSDIRFVWLRLLATYGPGDDHRHLIPSLIDQLLEGRRPAMTAGTQEWDYLYVTDAAEALYRCALQSGVSGVYNLASGRSIAVRALAGQIRDMIDPGLSLGIGEIPQPNTRPLSLRGDIGKLKEATGWEPRTDPIAGLRQTVEWHRSQKLKA